MVYYTYKEIHDPAAKDGVKVYLVDFSIDGKQGRVTVYVDAEAASLEYDSSGLTEWEDDEIFCSLSEYLL